MHMTYPIQTNRMVMVRVSIAPRFMPAEFRLYSEIRTLWWRSKDGYGGVIVCVDCTVFGYRHTGDMFGSGERYYGSIQRGRRLSS